MNQFLAREYATNMSLFAPGGIYKLFVGGALGLDVQSVQTLAHILFTSIILPAVIALARLGLKHLSERRASRHTNRLRRTEALIAQMKTRLDEDSQAEVERTLEEIRRL
jgi:hypothetical protein